MQNSLMDHVLSCAYAYVCIRVCFLYTYVCIHTEFALSRRYM